MNNCYQSLPNENKIECPICLEKIEYKNTIFSSCKHGWCKDCGKNITNNSCPICRDKYIGKTIHGHWEIINNNYQWIPIENRIVNEIRKAEKRLYTKEYRIRRNTKLYYSIAKNIATIQLDPLSFI